MPTCLYIRGAPGSGKHTTSRILERDLGWPRLWVHHFDAIYRAIGEYKVPRLTDKLMGQVMKHIMLQGRDLLVVRPTRDVGFLRYAKETCDLAHYWPRALRFTFLPVRLTASYATLVTRVTRRQCGNESPFRLTTKEALDEYLAARPESEFPGEHVINTDALTPEQVAGRIKELVCSTPLKV